MSWAVVLEVESANSSDSDHPLDVPLVSAQVDTAAETYAHGKHTVPASILCQQLLAPKIPSGLPWDAVMGSLDSVVESVLRRSLPLFRSRSVSRGALVRGSARQSCWVCLPHAVL